MPLVDFAKLFLTADNLRNNGKVDEAIKYYVEIATLATTPAEAYHKAEALHLAGVAAKENVADANSSYLRDGLAFFDQAEAAFKVMDDQSSLGAVYRDRAGIYEQAGQTNEAGRWFQQSLTTFQPLGETEALAISYDKFGLHYYKLGDYTTAENYINQALKILRRHFEAGFFTATALYDLARVKFKQKHFHDAVDLAEESRSWFAADRNDHYYNRRLAQLNGFLSLAYYETADTKNAQAAAQAYKKILPTLDAQAAKVLEKELEELAK